jgi:uncharacterized coiled-coil protein SlyX
MPFDLHVSEPSWLQWMGLSKDQSTLKTKTEKVATTIPENEEPDNVVPQPPKKSFQDASLKEPNQYIGETVKVMTDKQRQYEGILTRNDKYGIEITQHMSDGDVAFPIGKNHVIQFQVLK